MGGTSRILHPPYSKQTLGFELRKPARCIKDDKQITFLRQSRFRSFHSIRGSLLRSVLFSHLPIQVNSLVQWKIVPQVSAVLYTLSNLCFWNQEKYTDYVYIRCDAHQQLILIIEFYILTLYQCMESLKCLNDILKINTSQVSSKRTRASIHSKLHNFCNY